MENQQGQLRGYTLKERIGAGGLGAVYRALQSTIGREVAIKVILPHFANHPDFIRRFETEAQFVARLEHPHIIPLYDYWRDSNGAYLVMRYLRGGSLRDALEKDGAYTPESALALIDQLCAALAAAHRGGVIHRDLKPGNILLDEDGNAYLADFGIAKDLRSEQSAVTDPEALIGSPDYLAPEQARSEAVTPRTDIYSLGVVLYELLAGQHPFPDLSSIERMFKHLNDPLPAVTGLSPDITADVNGIIQKATSKNPAGRYADALELAADLRKAVKGRAQSLVELFTPREQEILALIVEGRSNKEIAGDLVIELTTVKWYITQIYRKLGVRGRVQAIVRARELNLITRDDGKPVEKATVVGKTDDFRPENPYKGLRAFQSVDHDDFFGREKLVGKLIRHLGERGEYSRFLAVVGPSGSGKSSLVRAGLIPALWRSELPGSGRWFIAEMMPGAHPLDKLEIALARIATVQAGGINEQLRRDERGLARVANLILPDDGSDLLLIVDQFEEVFTLVSDEAERTHFLGLLYAAVTEPHSRVRVLVTLRADFYDRPLHYPHFGEMMRERIETVLPLSADELERAISRPAERVGAVFETGLVASIIGEVNYQPGALPLLQYALTELFEQREGRILTHEGYRKIGGAGGALAKRADELYRELTPEGQEAARQMFLRLVTLGEGTEDTRRRAARSELLAIYPSAALTGANTELLDEIIDSYAEYRLLSLDNDPETRAPTVEVAHEALLREWERLRGWLNESRLDIRTQRQLSALAMEWKTAKHDASFLARGSRLDTFESWSKETTLALTGLERDYLAASLIQRSTEAQRAAEQEARESVLESRARRFLYGLVGVLVAALIIAIGLTGFALAQSRIAGQHALDSQVVALVAGSQASLQNVERALALALEAVRLAPDSGNAQAALSQAAYNVGTIRVFEGHTDHVDEARFSPDGRQVLSASWDKTACLWDVETGAKLRCFEGHADRVFGAGFLPDGLSAVSASVDGMLIHWDLRTGAEIRRFEAAGYEVWALALSPDGRIAAASGASSDITLWDVETGQIISTLTGHSRSIESLEFNRDGSQLLSGSHDTTLILWDMATEEIIRRFEGHFSIVTAARFNTDNSLIMSTALDGILRLWDPATGEMLDSFVEERDIWDVAFSLDGRSFVSAGIGGSIGRWNSYTRQLFNEPMGHGGTINAIDMHPDGRRAITAAADHTMRLWDLENGQVIYRFTSEGYWWNDIALSPDGTKTMISWRTPPYADVLLLETATGREIRRTQYELPIGPLDFSPDGRTSAQATDVVDGAALIIFQDVETGEERRRFRVNQGDIWAISYTPDGRAIVAGGQGGGLVLYDVTTGEEIRRFSGYEDDNITTNYWRDVIFTPDGKRLISAHISDLIVEWDVETGAEIRQFNGHSAWIWNFALSADGRYGYSGAEDQLTILWDMQTGTPLRRFTNTIAVAGVSISQDGRYGIEGMFGKLRDLETGEIVRQYQGMALVPMFLPDSRSAIVAPPANPPELWRIDLTLDDLLAWIRANRNIVALSCEDRALYRLEPLCETE